MKVLIIAALGWLFDTMDQNIYNLVRAPSSTVQPSLFSLVPDLPALIMGSIVKVIPSTSSIPVPGVP